jgi:hypothetical protein
MLRVYTSRLLGAELIAELSTSECARVAGTLDLGPVR